MEKEKMSEPKMVTAAFVISLVAGILIVLDNLGMILGWVGLPVFGGMVGSWIGLVSGFIVLIAAIMLRVRPGRPRRACALAVFGEEASY